MKKLLAVLLALWMLLSLASCCNVDTETTADSTGAPTVTTGSTEPTETTGSTEPTETTGSTGPIVPPLPQNAPIDNIPLETILYLLTDMTAEAEIGLSYMNRQELNAENAGYTIGYRDFSGSFESGYALVPQMNITPFVLAVFRLGEDADPSEFAKDLASHANLNKWVCVSADKKVTCVSGQTVLFMMCSERLEAPITAAFEQMTKPDFKVEEHLNDPLKDLGASNFYDVLLEMYGVAMYGFMDNENLGKVTAQSGYGLASLSLEDFSDTFLDDGYAAADEIFPERAYVFAMFDLAKGVSADSVVSAIKEHLDISTLKGEEPCGIVASSDSLVIVIAGTGSVGYSVPSLQSDLENQYRMNVTALEF